MRLCLARVQGVRVRVLGAGVQLEVRRIQPLALVFGIEAAFAVLGEIVFGRLMHVGRGGDSL